MDAIAFLAGVILIVAGLLGGGVELKEVKLPKVAGFVRVVAVVFGLGFIVLGLGLYATEKGWIFEDAEPAGADGQATAQAVEPEENRGQEPAPPPAVEARPGLSQARLVERPWRFSNEAGELIAEPVELAPDGRVHGVDHPNEAFWRLEDGVLVFVHEQGMPSTRFTEVEERDGRLLLRGRLLLEDEPVMHVLEQL